jgi:hypothetical protein
VLLGGDSLLRAARLVKPRRGLARIAGPVRAPGDGSGGIGDFDEAVVLIEAVAGEVLARGDMCDAPAHPVRVLATRRSLLSW